MSLEKTYFTFYLGCKTNKGQLAGICQNLLFIQSEFKEMQVFKIENLGDGLFLYLKQMKDLNSEEMNRLIEKGINIGRPKGYSFSVDALLFLLDLKVDLFGLIKAGYAKRLE